MAELLKNQFGVDIPEKIARMISSVFPDFNYDAFLQDAILGYDELPLMQRGKKIAQSLRRYLPADYRVALEILIASLGTKIDNTANLGMTTFIYLPHVCFVSEYGLDHFEISLQAQYELTQLFTAEFSIRPFIERYPEATIERLKKWACDSNTDVRRLVSEGTRPRLPWAPRLKQFQKDPGPVLELLELLKDDPELYVRRSVANNLNDIGKDHPELLVATAGRWMIDASEERRWIIRHGLRSAVKRAEPGALTVMGFGNNAIVSISNIIITPERVAVGNSVTLSFEITNTALRRQLILVDFSIHFVKANGKILPKVFKLKTINLAAKETIRVSKSISLAKMTTRKHYPGRHKIDVILNGNASELGYFELIIEA